MVRRVNTLKKVFVETGPFVSRYGQKPNGEGVFVFLVGMTKVTTSGKYAAAKNEAIEIAQEANQLILTLIDGPKPRRFFKKEKECTCETGGDISCPMHGAISATMAQYR